MGIASLHPSYALTFVHCQTIPQALMRAGIVGEAMSEFFKDQNNRAIIGGVVGSRGPCSSILYRVPGAELVRADGAGCRGLKCFDGASLRKPCFAEAVDKHLSLPLTATGHIFRYSKMGLNLKELGRYLPRFCLAS